MNGTSVNQKSLWPTVVGVFGAMLIVAALVWLMQRYSRPAPLGEDRVAARSKALKEMHAAEAEMLVTPSVLDAGKGLIRLPVTTPCTRCCDFIRIRRLPLQSARERGRGHSPPPKAPESQRVRVSAVQAPGV